MAKKKPFVIENGSTRLEYSGPRSKEEIMATQEMIIHQFDRFMEKTNEMTKETNILFDMIFGSSNK